MTKCEALKAARDAAAQAASELIDVVAYFEALANTAEQKYRAAVLANDPPDVQMPLQASWAYLAGIAAGLVPIRNGAQVWATTTQATFQSQGCQ